MRGRDEGGDSEVAYSTNVAAHPTYHHSVFQVSQQRNEHRDDSTVHHHLCATEGGRGGRATQWWQKELSVRGGGRN